MGIDVCVPGSVWMCGVQRPTLYVFLDQLKPYYEVGSVLEFSKRTELMETYVTQTGRDCKKGMRIPLSFFLSYNRYKAI